MEQICQSSLPPIQGLGTIVEKRVGRMEEPQGGEQSCDLLSSGYDMIIALMSSLRLWVPV